MAAKKKSRRARGTGSLFFDARRGVWVYRKYLGKNAAGKPRFLTRSHASQAELIRIIDSLQPPGPRTTVGEWGEKWLLGLDVRSNTFAAYNRSVRDYITPVLGTVQVASLTPHQIEQAARLWSLPAGPKDGLHPNTVRLTLAHLHTMLASAVRAGLIASNPASSARKPKGVRTAIDPFTPDELGRIIAEGTKRPNTRLVATLAATGMRVGEALALQVADYADGHLSITKGYTTSTPDGPPKTANSVRTIRVPLSAREAICAAIGQRTAGRLFCHAGHSSIREPWLRLLKHLGLRFRTPHQTRHGVATAMINAGVPLGDVAKYLGNTVGVLVRTYLHPSNIDPSLAMDGLLGGGKRKGR